MKKDYHPHVLGIDDGPFQKGVDATTPLIGVMMESERLVEAIAITQFAIDGDKVTEFLGDWIHGLRFRPALQAIVFGGVTIAGLGVIDIVQLSERLKTPVLVVNRRNPANHRLYAALETAGLSDRIPIVERMPPAVRVSDGLYVAAAGVEAAGAARLLRVTVVKSDLPEPLRIAHLIGRAIVKGESRGRP